MLKTFSFSKATNNGVKAARGPFAVNRAATGRRAGVTCGGSIGIDEGRGGGTPAWQPRVLLTAR